MPPSNRSKKRPLWGARLQDHSAPVGMMFGIEEASKFAHLLKKPELADQSDFLHTLICIADD
jgi:hypothetical protein